MFLWEYIYNFHKHTSIDFWYRKMYYIFLQGVASQGYIWLYDASSRDMLSEETFAVLGNESSQLLPIIHQFLSQNNVSYEQIENIFCVVWPGSFTWVRTVSLIVNTLAYIYPNIFLTPVNFFDLFDEYPIVKSSSKRDLFVKYGKNNTIEIVQNDVFEQNFQEKDIFWDIDVERWTKKYTLHRKIDAQYYMRNAQSKQDKRLSPLYIKKPNIH